MSTGYLLALLVVIPIAVAILTWIKCGRVTIMESAGGVACAIAVIFGTLELSKCGMTADKETWSGYASKAKHTPRWVDEHWETYTETEYYGTGKNQKSRTVTKRRLVRDTHSPTWKVETTLGEMNISESQYHAFTKHGERSYPGYRPDFYSGDRDDYSIDWETDPKWPIYPVSVTKSWENRLVASDSILNLPKVTEDEAKAKHLYEYPESKSLFESNRLLGDIDISSWSWDKMNAYVGPLKKVNLILINFGPKGSIDQAAAQRAYWHGGKKNDLVICIGAKSGEASTWCYVFGWSKSELVKQNLQGLFIDKPANSDIIPSVTDEVIKNFVRFDWHQFDDTEVPVPWWGIIITILLTLASQVGFYYWAINNEYNK